jgi:hypothetical protein
VIIDKEYPNLGVDIHTDSSKQGYGTSTVDCYNERIAKAGNLVFVCYVVKRPTPTST